MSVAMVTMSAFSVIIPSSTVYAAVAPVDLD